LEKERKLAASQVTGSKVVPALANSQPFTLYGFEYEATYAKACSEQWNDLKAAKATWC
jgi:hypothetical protein